MKDGFKETLAVARYDLLRNRSIYIAMIPMLMIIAMMRQIPFEWMAAVCLASIAFIALLARFSKYHTAEKEGQMASFLLSSGFKRKSIWDARLLTSLLIFPLFMLIAAFYEFLDLNIWQREIVAITLVFVLIPISMITNSKYFIVKDKTTQWKVALIAGVGGTIMIFMILLILSMIANLSIIVISVTIPVSLIADVVIYKKGVKNIETADV